MEPTNKNEYSPEMTHLQPTRDLWNRIAADWETHIGHDGDRNRQMNSDPVLWALAGDVLGLTVLDAGCGTGYLTQKLFEKGAAATGVDFSERMLEVARRNYPHLEFLLDSCTTLSTLPDAHFDLLVSNYMLMDTPDLEETVQAFYRVLKPNGNAVLIFSHPCFPQGKTVVSEADGSIIYTWPFSYFEPQQRTDPPWDRFTDPLIWFHRPLSDYWKAFVKTGFRVVDFEEPRVTPERYHLAESERKLRNARTRAYSVAFKLAKSGR